MEAQSWGRTLAEAWHTYCTGRSAEGIQYTQQEGSDIEGRTWLVAGEKASTVRVNQ